MLLDFGFEYKVTRIDDFYIGYITNHKIHGEDMGEIPIYEFSQSLCTFKTRKEAKAYINKYVEDHCKYSGEDRKKEVKKQFVIDWCFHYMRKHSDTDFMPVKWFRRYSKFWNTPNKYKKILVDKTLL